MQSQNQPRDPVPAMDAIDAESADLDPIALGFALGTTMAASVGLIGVLSRFGMAERWRTLYADLYPGFDEDRGGALAGVAWGGADGFVFGVTVGRLYNAFRRSY